MSTEIVLGLIGSTLRLSVPIALTALGELVTERSGIVNIGIEGIMVMGAFAAVVGTYVTGNPLIGLLTGVAVGIVFGLLHSLLSVYLYADQIIVGIGVIFFGYGITAVGNAIIWGQPGFSVGVPRVPHLLINIGGGLISISPNLILAFVLAFVLHYILSNTWIGLRLKAVGENPQAADVLGVNVFRVRILATMFGGAMAGLAGAYLGVDWGNRFVSYMSAGRGFIALASIIVGRWNPLTTLMASMIFGFFDALQMNLAQIYSAVVPPQLFHMIPYIVTIIIFSSFFKKARPPSSIAIPYRREI